MPINLCIFLKAITCKLSAREVKATKHILIKGDNLIKRNCKNAYFELGGRFLSFL